MAVSTLTSHWAFSFRLLAGFLFKLLNFGDQSMERVVARVCFSCPSQAGAAGRIGSVKCAHVWRMQETLS